MIKLQQFNVLAFTYERLANNNFDMKISMREAAKNEEMVALADNECLRAIRKITNHPFNFDGENKLNMLFFKRRQLVKEKNSKINRRKISEVNNEIRDLLYIPEFISVTTKNKRNYPKIGKDGFCVNGVHYSRFSCSAGNARTNKTMFVADTIFDELVETLRCGCKDIPMVAAKYNAYFSLTSSATFRVTSPRVCVVKDYEVLREELVDWVNETAEIDVQEEITREKRKLKFNLFDGMGIISPDFAEVWSKDLGLDYISGAYCMRNVFIKGMVCVFDYKRFAEEIAGNFIIKDLWGNERDVREVDVIISESQFKLWNAYESYEEYEGYLKKYGISWGVSKYAPKTSDEKNICRANYQFLQVLDLTEEDIQGLCEPTVNWFRDITGGQASAVALYLLGKQAKKDDAHAVWKNIHDNFVKALLIEPALAEDKYIKEKINLSIKKRIRESFIGKIWVNGNFEVAISDPYAFCEHLFGLPVKGLLNRDECYCNYWQNRNREVCAVLRSPLTWRSEVDVLSLPNTDRQKDWYKYLDSGVILNVHGVDCNLLGGSDFDFDILFITDNQYFIKGALNDKIPVAYEPKKAPKEKINLKNLYKTDVLGYGTEVGIKTNIGTTFYALAALYDPESKEYKELVTRNKLCCYQQSAEIDSAKGIAKKPMPRFWTKYTQIEDGDSKEIIEHKNFLNKIRAEKRPYFMKYLYPHYREEYENFQKDFNMYCFVKYGKHIEDLTEEERQDKKYSEMLEYYDKKCPLIDSPSVMNKICHHMEIEINKIKTKNSKFDSEKIFEKIFDNNIEIDNKKLKLVLEKYKEYYDFKKSKQLLTSEYNTYMQYYKHLRNDCLENISSNLQELANISVYICYKLYPCKKKDFCWDVFGGGIVENLSKKYKVVKVPYIKQDGEIEYLGDKFSMEDISLQKFPIDGQYSDENYIIEFCDFDEVDYSSDFDL